ncbi:MAG TPA: glucose-6-phosphate dehydrogenase [Candidatus Hydrogenedentes bacterium]|nr:glucose-6-phosphate dehydrogenase [Candidatus Hydrogenedentota bacterium]HQH53673.1 glucose-6-phosphate dehydrogenase [Candidatus Hydrogenedentota bacterium]HQM51071.1 glucose-6-phosphate dehydrogenase [Candidatus Hydrogenedentota bacterium]
MPDRASIRFVQTTADRHLSRFKIEPGQMATLVIFGATGDLAGRKLIPAIYNLWEAGYLPKRIAVVGAARRPLDENRFRQDMCEALKEFSRTGHGDSDTCDPFVSNIYYQQVRFDNAADYVLLKKRLDTIETDLGGSGNRLYYMASAPEFFAPITRNLGNAGCVYPPGGTPWSRIVVEKPFGFDLESAKKLNADISSVLDESQIFRIDHYLGKETVQNILAVRFGNAIFEALFSQKYVDNVQITVAETVGMEGRRGAFYDKVGALRDVVQNHALQLLCLVAMEPPIRFNDRGIRDEKLKVLNSIQVPLDEPLEDWCVRGQYREGPDGPGYLSEEGVSGASQTETYVALRLFIDNWRWAGAPFVIRTGKRMKKRVTEIAVEFKDPPMHLFRELGARLPETNVLVFRIQPDEGISLTFNAKPPGMHFAVQPVAMNFTYGATFEEDLPEAYERLLLDAIRGDSTLFMRSDEIESAWTIVTNIHETWKDAPPVKLYAPGSWGPEEAGRVFTNCRGAWRNP